MKISIQNHKWFGSYSCSKFENFSRLGCILGFQWEITCDGAMVWTPNFEDTLRLIILRNYESFISIPQVVWKLFVYKVWKIFAIGLYLRISTANNLWRGTGMNPKLSGYVALNNTKKLWKFHFHTSSGSVAVASWIFRVSSILGFSDLENFCEGNFGDSRSVF